MLCFALPVPDVSLAFVVTAQELCEDTSVNGLDDRCGSAPVAGDRDWCRSVSGDHDRNAAARLNDPSQETSEVPSCASTVEQNTAARDIYKENYSDIKRYVDILSSDGVIQGLIGPREAPRLWQRHILNCAAVAQLIPEGQRVADVGSGAGLPGIPVALLRPDLEITLIEPLARRYQFLTAVVDELHLDDQVTVIRSRAEDLHMSFDVVTARAVANLTKLLAWTAPLFLPSGELLALKGESVDREIAKADKELRKRRLDAEVLIVRAAADADPTRVVRVRHA